MEFAAIYRKMFYSPYFFTVAIRKKQKESIMEKPAFEAEYVMPASLKKTWYADPMLIDYGNKTYLFYEAVNDWHGHIEVAEVNEDCTLSAPTVILRDECHYSYPFVFEREGEVYMIPETSEANEVRLYRAADFPTRWEKIAVLLEERAVDTTVFRQNGTDYLLTFLTDGKSEAVTPKAYKMSFAGENTLLTEIPWEGFDPLEVRGAGPIFPCGGKQIRPVQRSREIIYGDAVTFMSAEASESAYAEEMTERLTPEHVKAAAGYYDGLHTYSMSEKFEAIDIRCREFDLLKPMKKLFG